MPFKENFRFDRLESSSEHYYNSLRGGQPIGDTEFEGYIKCKLVHTDIYSVIIPDLIYVKQDDENFIWFQICSFLPNFIGIFSDTEIYCTISIDIAFGNTLKIIFDNNNHVLNLSDNSNIFKCKIYSIPNLTDYSTGRGKIINNIPYLTLFHHTTENNKKLILNGNFYFGSKWNFQGTKKLENINYCYFTSLDEIKMPNDLRMIGMSNDEQILLIQDITDKIIPIKVYREVAENRTSTIENLVPSCLIANNHIYRHWQAEDGYTYYEFCTPFIYRVGVKPGEKLFIENNRIIINEGAKKMDYIIIGNANSDDGLLAPFDEENTSSIFKIEQFADNSDNILLFWKRNSNTDQYNNKEVEFQKFNGS